MGVGVASGGPGKGKGVGVLVERVGSGRVARACPPECARARGIASESAVSRVGIRADSARNISLLTGASFARLVGSPLRKHLLPRRVEIEITRDKPIPSALLD